VTPRAQPSHPRAEIVLDRQHTVHLILLPRQPMRIVLTDLAFASGAFGTGCGGDTSPLEGCCLASFRYQMVVVGLVIVAQSAIPNGISRYVIARPSFHLRTCCF
jgi:hypothetical protein